MSTDLQRTFDLEEDVSITPDVGVLRILPQRRLPASTPNVRPLKRVIEVLVCSILMVATLPVFVLVALIMKLTSKGPILHMQTRCGLDGKPFTFYKIRSMVAGAERQKSELRPLNETTGPSFKMYDDPRVTRLGRALRRTSIDEIPQLLHVLQGDMSLVGPRPPLPEEVAQYSPHELRRLSIKPGITGLWQVSGRSTLGFDKCVELDLLYIDNWSMWLDLKIIIKTIPAVLLQRGAW